MKKMIQVAAVVAVAAGLAGCGPQGMNNQTGGALAGGALGGILGATLFHGDGQVAGIIGGTLLGGLLGSHVGASMDRQDQMNMQRAIVRTPVNQEATWTNNRRHATYTVTPLRNYKNKRGRYCREYDTTVTVGGKKQSAYGKACRKPDGSWQIVS
jgi:surface antigen